MNKLKRFLLSSLVLLSLAPLPSASWPRSISAAEPNQCRYSFCAAVSLTASSRRDGWQIFTASRTPLTQTACGAVGVSAVLTKAKMFAFVQSFNTAFCMIRVAAAFFPITLSFYFAWQPFSCIKINKIETFEEIEMKCIVKLLFLTHLFNGN